MKPTLRQIENAFNGARYAHPDMPQKSFGRRLATSVRLNGDEQILDIGCGDGEITERLASRVPHGDVMGIDLSKSMIEFARRRQIKNARFRVHDACRLSPQLGRYDLIFSNATVHWLRNHKRFYSDCFKLCKPGGRVAFNYGIAGNNCHISEAILRTMRQPAFSEAFLAFAWPWTFASEGDVRQTVSEAGFTSQRITVERKDHTFADDDHVPWIREAAAVVFAQQLPSPHRSHFLDAVIGEFSRLSADESGQLSEQFWRVQVEAQRPSTESHHA